MSPVTRLPLSFFQTRIAAHTDAVRRAYQEEVVRWREQGTREFRRAGVDLMDVPIPELPNRDAVVKPILEFFRMREKREAKR